MKIDLDIILEIRNVVRLNTTYMHNLQELDDNPTYHLLFVQYHELASNEHLNDSARKKVFRINDKKLHNVLVVYDSQGP